MKSTEYNGENTANMVGLELMGVGERLMILFGVLQNMFTSEEI